MMKVKINLFLDGRTVSVGLCWGRTLLCTCLIILNWHL